MTVDQIRAYFGDGEGLYGRMAHCLYMHPEAARRQLAGELSLSFMMRVQCLTDGELRAPREAFVREFEGLQERRQRAARTRLQRAAGGRA